MSKADKYDFSEAFQEKVIALAIFDPTFLNEYSDVFRPEYFSSQYNQVIAGVVADYFRMYRLRPTKDGVVQALSSLCDQRKYDDDVREAVLEQLGAVLDTDITDSDFIKDKTIEFGRMAAVKNAILASVTLLEEANSDPRKKGQVEAIVPLIQEAMMVGSGNELGVEVISSAAKLGELRDNLNDPERKVRTGYRELDGILKGGLGTGEIGILMGETGLGKALSFSTPVLTPEGWKPIGSLKVTGNPLTTDQVIGSDGLPHRVTGVFPQGRRKLYKVTFSDSATTVCDGEHLWNVNTRSSRNPQVEIQYRTLTLNQIREEGLFGSDGHHRHYIPVMQPLDLPEVDLPLDPYIYGTLLSNAQFIPQIYLWAGTNQRLALLQGLLDAAGTVLFATSMSRTRLVLHSRQMVLDFRHLVNSLGGIVGTDSLQWLRSDQEKYVVDLDLPEQFIPFRLEDKQRQWNDLPRLHPARFIAEVEELPGEDEAVCITVDAPDKLFVIEHFVVTHNSMALVNLARNAVMTGKRVIYFTLELKQYDVAIRALATITNCTMDDVENNTAEFRAKVRQLEKLPGPKFLLTKYLKPSQATVNAIRSCISRMYTIRGQGPDLIVLDYLDEMQGATESSDSSYEAFGKIVSGLIEIGVDFKCPIWTATQIRRDGYNADPALAHVGESMKKVNKADLVIALCQTDEERAAGQMRYKLLKVRRGSGRNTAFKVRVDFAKASIRELPTAELLRNEEASEEVSNETGT